MFCSSVYFYFAHPYGLLEFWYPPWHVWLKWYLETLSGGKFQPPKVECSQKKLLQTFLTLIPSAYFVSSMLLKIYRKLLKEIVWNSQVEHYFCPDDTLLFSSDAKMATKILKHCLDVSLPVEGWSVHTEPFLNHISLWLFQHVLQGVSLENCLITTTHTKDDCQIILWHAFYRHNTKLWSAALVFNLILNPTQGK